MSLWEEIKKLFHSAEESKPYQPAVREAIVRSEAEVADYEKWKATLSKRRLIDWLNGEYVNHLVNPEHVDKAIDFLDVRSSKGFVIHFYKTQYPIRDVNHFFDFLKEAVLTMGYSKYTSDTRTYNRPNWVETVHRHYLKPSFKYGRKEGKKVNQRFGNITIEVLLRNDKVHNLKFSATSYSDHKYQEADDFDELMQEVLKF